MIFIIHVTHSLRVIPDTSIPSGYYILDIVLPVLSFSMTTNAVKRSFTKPVRPSLSRLNAAWRDKFRNKWYIKYSQKSKRWLDLKPTVDQAELPGTLPPPGYVNSFHGFLRYISQEVGEQHLNPHWRSISLLCQPCRFVYNYILDIETAQDDSKFVFEELGYETRLPKSHSSSKTNNTSLEDYFKDQGCSNHFHFNSFGICSQGYKVEPF